MIACNHLALLGSVLALTACAAASQSGSRSGSRNLITAEEIQNIDARSAATMRFGTGHPGEAILVTTRR